MVVVEMNTRTQNALTLTELLVSTILMGIVMGGVAAFSLFVKQSRDSTGAGTILAVQTATAMHYLVQDANKAVGDNSNRGVISDSPPPRSVCFRHDASNPAVYTDDTWACYWYDAPSNGLWKCADRNAIATVPPANFNDCIPPVAGFSRGIKLVTIDPGATQYFNVIDNSDGRFLYVDITLNTIANPGQAANTIANPTYQLFTRVSPPAHGR